MKKILTLTVLILMGLVSPSYGQDAARTDEKTERYLCIGEQTAGFKYNQRRQEWLATIFKADKKYIIREANKKEENMLFQNNKYVVVEHGGEVLDIFYCEDYSESGYLECTGWGGIGNFLFYNKSLHFMVRFYGTYLPNIIDEGGDTPYMQIGKCTPF